MNRTAKLVLLCLVIFVIGVVLSALITHHRMKRTPTQLEATDNRKNPHQHLTQDGDETIAQKLLHEINAENIREYLRELTEHPHLAGTPADLSQAEDLKDFWENLGLKSWVTPYDVLLSYPEKDNPNRIELQDGSGNELFTTQLMEKILRPEQNQSDVVPPFNAFSAKGQPKGPLIYVNYGRIEDFTWLKENKSINFHGKICIARYGKIFRGNKGMNAERFGASGLILYSDPDDYVNPESTDVYPDSWWLPSTGVQRGNVRRTATSGDQLTPDYPAIESAYRVNESDADLPKIPIHPISYGDARMLLQNMAGEVAPAAWQGDLPITYRIGPGFEDSQWNIQMFISTENRMATTYNAFGMIKGSVEPDRYVMFGNHRDGWVFGAVDPSSGTAVMKELSRAVGKLVNEGWRPRRSIIFCSWAAEEYGLVGSTEWVQQYGKAFSNRIVSYTNVDSAIEGDFTIRPRSSPIVKHLLFEVAKMIPNPDPTEVLTGRTMLYDTWKRRLPEKDTNGQITGKPKVPILGSGSDYAPFIDQQGITCVDLTYLYDRALGIASPPLYHTVYETFHLVNDIIDPTFVFHQAISRFSGELLRRLSDSYILPFDVRQYGTALLQYKQSLLVRLHKRPDVSVRLEKPLDYLDKALTMFTTSADDFHQRLLHVNKNNPMEVRMLNDQMMHLGKNFINPQGLPHRPLIRNILFAPSMHNNYAGSSFPGVVDTLFELEPLSVDDDAFEQKLEEVKKQLSIVTFCIEAAAALLTEYDTLQNMV